MTSNNIQTLNLNNEKEFIDKFENFDAEILL